MKTKITLTIDGTETELTSDCLMNWDEVKCTYKRTDFSGVVRSFSSAFEFVNDAYDLLLAAYLKDGMRASVVVALWVLNNDWTWSKEFEAALNFSTATWDGYVFSVNCLDDGLAALIKARKSTKYEFVVGEEIGVGGILNYDRVTMQNSCAHEIEGDSSASDGSVLLVNASSSTRLPVYSLTSETFENSPILFEDQGTDAGAAFITTEKLVSNMKMRLEIWTSSSGSGLCYAESVNIHLMRFTNTDQNMVDLGTVFSYSAQKFALSSSSATWGICDRTCVGTFKSLADLQRAYPNPPQDVWAKIGPSDDLSDVESVYFTPISNNADLVKWEYGHMTKNSAYRGGPIVRLSCETKKYIMEFEYDSLGSGQKFALFYTAKIVNISGDNSRTPYFPLFSKITTNWESKANAINITAIRPQTLVSSLMEKITDSKYNVIPNFSEYDSRLAKTYLLPAECVRDLPDPKIYTSFNEFCDWMETVFGYVYELGDVVSAEYNGIAKFDGIEDDWVFNAGDIYGRVVDGYCPDECATSNIIIFIKSCNCFCIFDDHETGNVYTQWKNSYKYNNTEGIGRNDVIFDDGSTYYVMEGNDLVEFEGDAKTAARPTQTINFMHRSEIFQNAEQGVLFTDAVELQTKINSNTLYSIVEVGYEKQDYETECGRDEWNFMNYYNTGIDVTEKKLTLQSKYRADCYGLEFLAEERAKDSTDNKSDNTVFFVYCRLDEEEEEQEYETTNSRGDTETVTSIQQTVSLYIDRTVTIEGAMSDSVFNGEFSPYYCVKANEGYISAMAPDVTLQFASSDGNSDIVIDGVKTTDNIPLADRLFSESELKFTATDLDQSIDFSKLIQVEKHGLLYSGFLKEVEFCYARPSEVDYTIIVKSIEQL